jgi:hypothetical protein
MKKFINLSFAMLILYTTNAQATDGDLLMNLIGSKPESATAQKFMKAYEIQRKPDGIYSASKSGIDMRTRNDSILSITFYKSNPIYGAFAGKLPKGISFDQNSTQIIKTLGKPAVEYKEQNYCEYHYGMNVLTCWFEKGLLRRITISSKSYHL